MRISDWSSDVCSSDLGAPEPSPKSDGSAYIHKVRSMEQFDVIVVGGGSAGCALAGRLSANPRLTVLLIEAGEDFVPGREPASIRDPGARTMIRPRFFWSDLAEERGRPVFQARVVGGGSTVNGMQAQRGFITEDRRRPRRTSSHSCRTRMP